MISHHTPLCIRRVYQGYETARILGIEYPQLRDRIRTAAVHNLLERGKCGVHVWENVDSILGNHRGPASTQGFLVCRRAVDEAVEIANVLGLGEGFCRAQVIVDAVVNAEVANCHSLLCPVLFLCMVGSANDV